jgi:endonuclease/exonuclease/phosphatase family metal-dependent hydrolase
MMSKILFLNLGYARGISGRLSDHIRYAHRHIYCPPVTQKQSLDQLAQLIKHEAPDLCCFVEIDQGSYGAARYNQLSCIVNAAYGTTDIENKYARDSVWRSFGPTAGKSNAFMSRRDVPFEKLFFKHGMKRLIYKIDWLPGLTILFAHFSLQRATRAKQLLEARALLRQIEGETIFLGDFNVLSGLAEIEPLLDGGKYVLLNQRDTPTFFFHRKQSVLDLCICSARVARQATLTVLPQAYTDHAALIVDLPDA